MISLRLLFFTCITVSVVFPSVNFILTPHKHHCGTTATLQHHCNTTETPLQDDWNTTATPLLHHYNSTGTRLQHDCNTTATPLQHNCNTTATPLQHDCYTTVALLHNWNSTATPLKHYWSTTPSMNIFIFISYPFPNRLVFVISSLLLCSWLPMLRYLKDVLCTENTGSRLVEAAEKLQLQAVNLAQKPVIWTPHHHQL